MAKLTQKNDTMIGRALFHILEKKQPSTNGEHLVPCPYCHGEAYVR